MASKPQGPDATESDSGMGIIDNKMLPPSLVQIERILSVASEIDRVNPRVAFLCRFHAFEKAHKCCRSSRGDAVSQFKAALLQRVKREGKATIEGRRNHDHYEIRAFYRHYCEKYIQGLLNAYNADRTRLTKAYQTAAVLFEVVECVLSNKVPDEILEVHKQVAEKAEIFFHNIRHKVNQPNHLKIPLHAIKHSTQDFNELNLIGRGGYGRVYKGILSWGDHVNQLVAVKRLDVNGFQGNKEFYTELTMLSQYQHDNIITLIGFCDENNEMILVYEYACHGSLDTYLRDTTVSGGPTWPQLLKICIGVCSALDYLHNHVAEKHRIIHRDIKSANILLDENWNAKLADFGLCRIGLANQQNTFVITNLAGTHGYCDPQYERTGLLTKESDVFSFGVVLFEVLCGRLACALNYHDEQRFLHNLARTCYKNGELEKIIDRRIRTDIKPETLLKFSAIAYQCLQEAREQRPTIVEVAFQLKEAWKIQLEDKIIQGELEDVILQDQLHFSGCKEGMKQGRLGRLKSKVKFRFCGCSKKQ